MKHRSYAHSNCKLYVLSRTNGKMCVLFGTCVFTHLTAAFPTFPTSVLIIQYILFPSDFISTRIHTTTGEHGYNGIGLCGSHLSYCTRYSVALINSFQLTITLHYRA